MTKLDKVIVKVGDMAKGDKNNEPCVRNATLEWAREELRQLSLNSEEIGHILETQELLCELGKSNKDDGSCSLCRSIKAKLRP